MIPPYAHGGPQRGFGPNGGDVQLFSPGILKLLVKGWFAKPLNQPSTEAAESDWPIFLDNVNDEDTLMATSSSPQVEPGFFVPWYPVDDLDLLPVMRRSPAGDVLRKINEM